MGLGIEDIKKRLKERRKGSVINRARNHQNRIKFHCETAVVPTFGQPLTEFLNFVENLIPEDKFQIFKTLFRYPVKTNEVTGICFDKLSRIFEGRNPAYNYQFLESEKRDDWEYYRQNILKEPEIWATKGWGFFKNEINSILIVDLPTEQDATDRYPQPYFYWLPIEQVIDFEADPTTGVMHWIIFRQSENRIAVIDDERYRVFREKDGDIVELLIDNPHDLRYCPAKFFWNQAISLKEPFVMESPVTKQLANLDWYLFFHESKKHLDLYGAYPIYSSFEQTCDYVSANGDMCDRGFLKDKQGYYKMDSAGVLMRCPKCGKKSIAGVGSFVEIPIPDENQPNLQNPVQILTIDRNSLDYNVTEEGRLRNDIITAIVGTNEEITTRDALNEQQIKANFESQSKVLNIVKKGFEEAQQFVDETVCRLRYGDNFISAKVNYGTEFYIYDVTELRNRYKIAKESGASEAELDALQNHIIETEYRHDTTQMQRLLILAELEPYRHLTRQEVLNLYSQQLISEPELRVKLNFANFVRRFERENTNILEFGTQIPFAEKIKIITQKLYEYESENGNRGN